MLRARQRRAGRDEVNDIEMLDQSNNVTAFVATAAVPNTLSGVDAESVGAAASRAWPAALNLAAIELNAAALNLVLDRYGARFV